MEIKIKDRYNRYSDYPDDSLKRLAQEVKKSPWRAQIHVEPETGLLNDPNGFSYFNGRFHLWYQHFPYGPVHGLKSWTHVVSTDAVHWRADGLVLLPDTVYESHGAYSGSALVKDAHLFLMYTGNHREEDGTRIPYQLGARLDAAGNLVKMKAPLIEKPTDVSEHFRDPMLFRQDAKLYALIGAQDLSGHGKIKLYRNAADLWEEVGDLDFGHVASEYMVECPNLAFVDGHVVLIFCPQELAQTDLEYQTIFPNAVVVSDGFDAANGRLKNPSALTLLDAGFDCYATQIMQDENGAVFAVSWLGLPDVAYPTDDYGYQGALSLVKRLSVKNGKLYQYPLVMRGQEIHDFAREKTYELELVGTGELSVLGGALKISVSADKVVIDRSGAEFQFDVAHGATRTISVSAQKVNIFIDCSIFEIFINDGEKVASGRVFPGREQTGVACSSTLHVQGWELL
ncbi:MAG: sucrose-6-phosphate hydrolase [Streptococcaceae bacterium]|jgi:beta-fructofuranosidase|nr:sucrose-6-phosphate hydrolase [Streptococcaceae bacterium]